MVMKDQKISTGLGTIILIIIAATVSGFVFLCYKNFSIDSEINGTIDPLVASRLNQKIAYKYENNAEKQNNSTKKSETYDCSQDINDQRICKDGTRGMRFDENCNHIDSCGIKEVDGMMISSYTPYIIKNNEVYYEDFYFWKDGKITKIEDADPSTFKVFERCMQVEMSLSDYAIDKSHLYAGSKKLDSIDIKSFQYLGLFATGANMPYAAAISKDKNKIYFGCGVSIDSIDRESFTVLENGYSKDKNTVFYISFITIADPITIEMINHEKTDGLNGNFALDRKNVYFEGRVVKGVDPKLCKKKGLKFCLPENWQELVVFSDGEKNLLLKN